MVNHPLRRRVIMLFILLGNARIVAAASALVLGFTGAGVRPSSLRMLERAAGLLALPCLSRSSSEIGADHAPLVSACYAL